MDAIKDEGLQPPTMKEDTQPTKVESVQLGNVFDIFKDGMKCGRRSEGHAECYIRMWPRTVQNGEKLRHLTDMQVPKEKRGRGAGSRLLKKVCAEADQRRNVLLVEVAPYGDSEGTKEQLYNWYHRFGFRKIQEEPLIMARAPRNK